MKKKVLALLWAFNNPAWAFILSQEFYEGLHPMASNIEDQEPANFEDQYWSLMEYFRANNIKTQDDVLEIWDAVIETKNHSDRNPVPASFTDEDEDEDWDDEETPEEGMRPPFPKYAILKRKWNNLIKSLPQTIKDYKPSPNYGSDPWHLTLPGETTLDFQKLVDELELMIENVDEDWAIEALHSLHWDIYRDPNNKFSADEFRKLMAETNLIPASGNSVVWARLRNLHNNYPEFYNAAELWAWS